MNQRIQLLAEQADLGWAIQRASIYRDHADLKSLNKFAELIIEECAKLAEYQGYNQAFGQGGLRIKLHEHFGISGRDQ
jgi:hypothetical protein